GGSAAWGGGHAADGGLRAGGPAADVGAGGRTVSGGVGPARVDRVPVHPRRGPGRGPGGGGAAHLAAAGPVALRPVRRGGRGGPARQADRQPLPQADEALVAGVVGPQARGAPRRTWYCHSAGCGSAPHYLLKRYRGPARRGWFPPRGRSTLPRGGTGVRIWRS